MATEPEKNKFQPQGRVKVIQGSILTPHEGGLRFILNLANLAGAAESPLYPLFEKKWPKVKQEAKGWYNTRTGAYKLGSLYTVSVQSDVWVILMLVQNGELKTDLKGLQTCLKAVCKQAKEERASIHCSSLLTQAIPELSDLIQKELVENGVAVCYYDEPTK